MHCNSNLKFKDQFSLQKIVIYLLVYGSVLYITYINGQPGEVAPSLHIVIPERSSVTRNQYDDAEFICHLTNFPPKTEVTWFFVPSNVTSVRIAQGKRSISQHYEVSSTAEQLDPNSYTYVYYLHIQRIDIGDDGMYMCSARFNGSLIIPAQVLNETKRLIVKVPVDIIVEGHTVKAAINDEALLVWKVVGHPKPPINQFTILRGGRLIEQQTERYTVLSSDKAKSVMEISLHIAWVKPEDFGFYTLIYRNNFNQRIPPRILLREIIVSTTTPAMTRPPPTTLLVATPWMSIDYATIGPVIPLETTIPDLLPISIVPPIINTTRTPSPTSSGKPDDVPEKDNVTDKDDEDKLSNKRDKDDSDSQTLERSLIFAGVGAAVATVIIGAIVGLVLWQRKKIRQRKKQRDTSIYLESRPQMTQPVGGLVNIGYEEAGHRRQTRVQKLDSSVGKGASCYTVLEIDRYEFPRQRLRVLDELGHGKFGHIVLGEALNILGDGKWTTVAVKMAKDIATDSEKEDIRRELEIMRLYPPHPNVVKLLGCCIKEDPALIIMEYLPHGNLQEYLRQSRPGSTRSSTYGKHANTALTSKDLTQFSWQAARGMTHLAAHNIIHRDLAARNVLVGNNRVCKVSDFGLARNVAGTDHYERNSKGPLPVRWMSPETFHDAYYTDKSDVWAYGILLWEIVTLGASPYPGLSAEEVMKFVMSGEIMVKPPHCDDELYNIMCRCWCSTAEKRPAFPAITKLLENLLESNEDYIELKDYEEDDYLYITATSQEKC